MCHRYWPEPSWQICLPCYDRFCHQQSKRSLPRPSHSLSFSPSCLHPSFLLILSVSFYYNFLVTPSALSSSMLFFTYFSFISYSSLLFFCLLYIFVLFSIRNNVLLFYFWFSSHSALSYWVFPYLFSVALYLLSTITSPFFFLFYPTHLIFIHFSRPLLFSFSH